MSPSLYAFNLNAYRTSFHLRLATSAPSPFFNLTPPLPPTSLTITFPSTFAMSEIPTTQTIISALSQSHSQSHSHFQIPTSPDIDELNTWSIDQLKDEVRTLRDEVVRLREEVASGGKGSGKGKGKGKEREKEKEKKGVKRKLEGVEEEGKKPRKDEETGKRVERARKTELSIAIRAKVRVTSTFFYIFHETCKQHLLSWVVTPSHLRRIVEEEERR
jgi:hypothetical protein